MAGRRRASTRSVPEPALVRIGRVGAEGDGVGALADGAAVFVPFTLAGELVRAVPTGVRGGGWAARGSEIVEASPDRVAPPCVHFGTCGGCAMQHWAEAPYLAWKTDMLRQALARGGFPDAAVAPIHPTVPGGRRRMDLAIRRRGRVVQVGLHQARGPDVVDLAACAVLHPDLVRLIAPLRAVLTPLAALRREGSAVVNQLDSGPDVLVRTDAACTLADRQALIAFARAVGAARLSWARGEDEAEAVCVLRPPVIAFGGVSVTPPPGAFLQASQAGEAAIVAAVLAGLPAGLGARALVAELYAGCGTLTFPLARHARVAAWEGDAATAAALRSAVRQAGLAGRIEATQRDLARQPLTAAELQGAAAVVLDPPHAGTARQIAAIAEAHVPRVIYVSCNPAALARDARVLHASGYTVLSAAPIDQFLWSARLESVVVFANSGATGAAPR